MSEMPADVAAVFAGYPARERALLLEVRDQIRETAEVCGAGPLTETLKWGQPAYLTEATGAGTTVRLGLDKGTPAIFFHCQTSLVESFRADFPEAFAYAGNRALHLRDGFDRDALGICLGRALTYHRNKRKAGA